jgi:hypothetical protein
MFRFVSYYTKAWYIQNEGSSSLCVPGFGLHSATADGEAGGAMRARGVYCPVSQHGREQ